MFEHGGFMKGFVFKSAFTVFILSSLLACGVAPNQNVATPNSEKYDVNDTELIQSSEDFVAQLLESEEEADEMGLVSRRAQAKTKKAKPPRRNAAAQARPQQRAPQAKPPAQAGNVKKAEKKRVAVKKKLPQPNKAVAGKKPANKNLVERAKKAFKKQGRLSAKHVQRQNNLVTGVGFLQNAKLMPNIGLEAAYKKCQHISEGIQFLKSTKAPARPFDGLRSTFRAALAKERKKVAEANGFTTCKDVATAFALVNRTPAPQDVVADEPVPAVDAEDSFASEVVAVEVEEEMAEEVNMESAVFDDNGNVIEAEVIVEV